MSLIINNQKYDFKDGIGLLKSTITENYDELPDALKHEDVKEQWDNYIGIPQKLYLMCKSEDSETLNLAADILEQDYKGKITYKISYFTDLMDVKKEVYSIILFSKY